MTNESLESVLNLLYFVCTYISLYGRRSCRVGKMAVCYTLKLPVWFSVTCNILPLGVFSRLVKWNCHPSSMGYDRYLRFEVPLTNLPNWRSELEMLPTIGCHMIHKYFSLSTSQWLLLKGSMVSHYFGFGF